MAGSNKNNGPRADRSGCDSRRRRCDEDWCTWRGRAGLAGRWRRSWAATQRGQEDPGRGRREEVRGRSGCDEEGGESRSRPIARCKLLLLRRGAAAAMPLLEGWFKPKVVRFAGQGERGRGRGRAWGMGLEGGGWGWRVCGVCEVVVLLGGGGMGCWAGGVLVRSGWGRGLGVVFGAGRCWEL